MAIKLYRCKNLWVKSGGHPCWRVQKALDDAGIEYEIVVGPWPAIGKREDLERLSGQKKYCLLYTSPSPRDLSTSRMPSSA